MTMKHYPEPGSFLLFWAGDIVEISLVLNHPETGRAVFRTNIGNASIHRQEIIARTDSDEPVLANDWHDVPMEELHPGHYILRIPLTEVGIFAGKACFFPKGSSVPQWPEGDNVHFKVEPANTACGNTMYTAFVRQFGAALGGCSNTQETQYHEAALDRKGYTVIPPSGTFRDLIGHLDTIMGTLRFRILQLLPIHPVPTTFARMGRFGSAFAALDFLSVDPALAVFDTFATPLDQFRELVDAVHARGGTLYMDLPANHTGWAATLQTHHPEWYHRRNDGEFVSPGAWGVTWADLVELDYRDTELRAYMAKVFLFWCSQGVDGFRCDAGYMIPEETWTYIIARVRESYPDTVFLLEGLGGKLEVTDKLLSCADMNWAYSELFQTMDRSAFEWYLPQAIERSERCGPLIHFAETHDNNRLAASGKTFSRLRVTLSALLSHAGAFGMANGVEWFATEKIDVHGASGLNWGASENQIAEISHLNTLLACHPSFGPNTHLQMIEKGKGPVLAVLRKHTDNDLLVLINLDCHHPQVVCWEKSFFTNKKAVDLLTGRIFANSDQGQMLLQPGEVRCLSADIESYQETRDQHLVGGRDPLPLAIRKRNLMALRVRKCILKEEGYTFDGDINKLGSCLIKDPLAFCAEMNQKSFAPCVTWNWPEDLHREVPVPNGFLVLLLADHPFRAKVSEKSNVILQEEAIFLENGKWALFLPPHQGLDDKEVSAIRQSIEITVFTPQGIQKRTATLIALPPADKARIRTAVSGKEVREDLFNCTTPPAEYQPPRNAFTPLHTVLSNTAGAMSYVRAAWGNIRSQYDCILGLNPDPNVPADKWIFWTRCRAWLRYRGYSQEVSASCMTQFTADPAGRFATWSFHVPCGIGHWIPLEIRLDMAKGENRVRLTFTRQKNEDALNTQDEITLILRPDIEWRSFHQKTKAYCGPENEYPQAVHAHPTGFTFAPLGAPAFLGWRLTRGTFHVEPEWSYLVGHPEETERGLEGTSDLFSPGWADIQLYGGESAEVIAGEQVDYPFHPLSSAKPQTSLPAKQALSEGLSLFVVKRDAFKTVIAGYPWFLDWGRDTLIVLRGLIADGQTGDALAILREFGRFEEFGTLPNIIHGNTVGNRDTSDAPLWFFVATADLCKCIGTTKVLDARCGERSLKEVLTSILENNLKGTPNGVRMDPETALLFSPPHFTWMDTNYPAGTPREGYPVEIQALWIAALRFAAQHIDSKWNALAEQAEESLIDLFPLEQGGLADCLRAHSGISAKKATQEDAIRPNQLYAITLGAIRRKNLQKSILQSCERLLIPGAIRSLADQIVQADMGIWRDGTLLNDPHAPYQGHYRGDEDSRRKPAYHNGTAWSLPFPLYPEAFVKVYGNKAKPAAFSLLASALLPINLGGCLAQIAEIFDGDAPHIARGTSAQAWGLSEILRVWKLLS